MSDTATAEQFVLQVWNASQAPAEPGAMLNGMGELEAALAEITYDTLQAGARARWRRVEQPDVWLDVLPLTSVDSLHNRTRTEWTCVICNTRIGADSSRPRFVLDAVDGYAPHDHDGQTITVEMAKTLVREAYAAAAAVPGESWVLISEIFERLGPDFRTRPRGALNDPHCTGQIAIVLMQEQDADFAINTLPDNAPADGHQRLVYGGGWGDAILIGPVLPKPSVDEED